MTNQPEVSAHEHHPIQFKVVSNCKRNGPITRTVARIRSAVWNVPPHLADLGRGGADSSPNSYRTLNALAADRT